MSTSLVDLQVATVVDGAGVPNWLVIGTATEGDVVLHREGAKGSKENARKVCESLSKKFSSRYSYTAPPKSENGSFDPDAVASMIGQA